MNISALLMTLCSLCFSTPATAGDIDRSQECFVSQTQAWKVYPGQHLYHHKTPNGLCYHIGKKNHSGVFTNHSLPKSGKFTSNTSKHRWSIPDQWSVYPESKRWPKLYGTERTRDYQDYEKPFRYSDPWK